MNVAIYCRVSTEEQSPEKQEAELRKYCEMRELGIQGVYTDIISGTKSSRPQLDKMLQAAYKREFKAIVIWKLDRMGRSVKHLIDVVTKLKKWRVDLICTTQNIDTTTPNGKFLFHILGAFAELERDMISERTKMGLKLAKNVGKRGKDKKPRRKSGYHLRWSKQRGG